MPLPPQYCMKFTVFGNTGFWLALRKFKKEVISDNHNTNVFFNENTCFWLVYKLQQIRLLIFSDYCSSVINIDYQTMIKHFWDHYLPDTASVGLRVGECVTNQFSMNINLLLIMLHPHYTLACFSPENSRRIGVDFHWCNYFTTLSVWLGSQWYFCCKS